jgi:hypothetical protein
VDVLVEHQGGEEFGSSVSGVLPGDDVLCGPGQWALKGDEEVDDSPSNDDCVVEGDGEGTEDGSHTDTGKSGVDTSEDTDVTTLELLSERELEHEHRKPEEEEAKEVGHEEETTTMLEAKIGETPEVSQSDS